MGANEPTAYNLVDISIKRLVRDNPAAFLELTGFTVAPEQVRFEDTAIQQREQRADHVCIITKENGIMRGIIYMEYQTAPDPDILPDWVAKWIALVKRFPVPVVMLVVYVYRGNYATFHQDYRVRLEGFETAVLFNAVRLWEYAPQIRSGKYPDFVPLLTLCEDNPTEETVREQVALIQSADMDAERKEELLSLSFIVASRDVSRSILVHIIREVFTMKTLPTIVEDMFGDALRERELQRVQQGKELGALEDARAILIRLYTKRLGAPPVEIVTRLEAIDNIDSLHKMIDRYDEQFEGWEQLFLPASTD